VREKYFEFGKLLTDVIAVVKSHEPFSGTSIPIIAAGGVFTGACAVLTKT
jgi:NAD(P)H-dependent flavin oxidoreductase YrpB (nitropropane dioxygenase family)